MAECLDACTAFNLALCIAIAWGVPEYVSQDCFDKFCFFYPVYASFSAVASGAECIRNWCGYWVLYATFSFFSSFFSAITIPYFGFIQSSFMVYCMHPKFCGANRFFDAFVAPVFPLLCEHMMCVLVCVDHFFPGYFGDGFFCKMVFFYAAFNTTKCANANWLCFWVMYASLMMYGDMISGMVPYYAIAKKVVMMWAMHDSFKGATVLYTMAIAPWFPTVEATVKKITDPVMNAVCNAGEKKND